MDKSLAIRRIRIAVSVFFGVLTVALCVVWGQSYSWIYLFQHKTRDSRLIHVSSAAGLIKYQRLTLPPGDIGRALLQDLSFKKNFVSDSYIGGRAIHDDATYFAGFGFHHRKISADYWIPYWFLVAMVITIGVLTVRYLPRFSLRTMLIATTLVAVVLGLGVWLAN